MTMLNESLDELATWLGGYENDGAVLEPEAVKAITHLLKVAAGQARMLEATQQRVTAAHLQGNSNVILWPVARRSIPLGTAKEHPGAPEGAL